MECQDFGIMFVKGPRPAHQIWIDLCNGSITALTQEPRVLKPMEDFMKAVQRESDQVATELDKILSQLEPLIEERRRLEERARALESVMSTYQGGSRGSAAGTQTRERHFLDVAHEILQREGQLYYEDLLARLSEAGVTVPGRNPGANLIAHMSRDKRFKRVARGTYTAES